MQIKQTSSYSTNNTTFHANFAKNSAVLNNYKNYLECHKNAPAGCFNTSKHLELFTKIENALNKHPSNAIIHVDETYEKGSLFGTRGVLSTARATITDSEPTRDDSIAVVENVFRKILNPENKAVFNKLLGEKYLPSYNEWWQKNISPIWNDIKTNFRETVFDVPDSYEEFRSKNRSMLG